MSLIYLAQRPSRGNKIINEGYHFWPHFAHVFKANLFLVKARNLFVYQANLVFDVLIH